MKHLPIALVLSVLIFSSCKKDKQMLPDHVPGHVSVAIKDPVTIDRLFDLINEQQLEVVSIHGYEYTIAGMAADSVAPLMDYLHSKAYMDDPSIEGDRRGYVTYDTAKNVAHVHVWLFGMSDEAYQQDWLKTISELEMTDVDGIIKGMMISVPVGKEPYWAAWLCKYEIVQWAGLDGIVQLYNTQ